MQAGQQDTVGSITERALKLLEVEGDTKQTPENRQRAAQFLDQTLGEIGVWGESRDDRLREHWYRVVRTVALNRNRIHLSDPDVVERRRQEQSAAFSDIAENARPTAGGVAKGAVQLGITMLTSDPSAAAASGALSKPTPGMYFEMGMQDELVDERLRGTNLFVNPSSILHPSTWGEPEAIDTKRFQSDPEVAAQPASITEEAMYRHARAEEIRFNETLHRDNGKPYKKLSNGEEVDLPDLREGQTVEIPMADGSVSRAVVDSTFLASMANARGEAWTDDTITGGLLSRAGYAPDRYPDKVLTPFGERYVPKITGNAAVDRDLFEKPEWQASLEQLRGGHGITYKAWKAAYSGAEFVGLMLATRKLGSVAGGIAKPIGGWASEHVPGVAKMGEFAKTTASALGTAALEGGRPGGSLAAPGLHFDVSQFGEQLYYTAAVGAANGDWSPKEWTKGALAQTVTQYVFGGIARAGRSAIGMALQSGKLDRALSKISRGALDETDLAGWASRYAKGEESALLKAGADSFIAAREGTQFGVQRAIRDGLFGEYGRMMRREAAAQFADTAFVGYMFGRWKAAQINAEKDGRDWEQMGAADKLGYFTTVHPLDENALGDMAGMLAVQAGFTVGQTGNSMFTSIWDRDQLSTVGRKLAPKEMRETIENLSHFVLYKARDAAHEGNLGLAADAFFGGAVDGPAREMFLRKALEDLRGESGAGDLLAGDTDASFSKSSVQSLIDIYDKERGPDVLRAALRGMSRDDLVAQDRRLRLDPSNTEHPSTVVRAKDIRDLIGDELARREAGGKRDLKSAVEEVDQQGPKVEDGEVPEGGVADENVIPAAPPPARLSPAEVDAHYTGEIVTKQADPASNEVAPYPQWRVLDRETGKPEATVEVSSIGAVEGEPVGEHGRNLILTLSYRDPELGNVEVPNTWEDSPENRAEAKRLGLVAIGRLAPQEGDLQALGMEKPPLSEVDRIALGEARTRPGRLLQQLTEDPRLGSPRLFRRLNAWMRGEGQVMATASGIPEGIDPALVRELVDGIRASPELAARFQEAKRRAAARALRETLGEMADAGQSELDALGRMREQRQRAAGREAGRIERSKRQALRDAARDKAENADRRKALLEQIREVRRSIREAAGMLKSDRQAAARATRDELAALRAQRRALKASNVPTIDDVLTARAILTESLAILPKWLKYADPDERIARYLPVNALQDKTVLFAHVQRAMDEAAKVKAMFGLKDKPRKIDRSGARVRAARAQKAAAEQPAAVAPPINAAEVLTGSLQPLYEWGAGAFRPAAADDGQALQGLMMAALLVRHARAAGAADAPQREMALAAGVVMGGLGPGKLEGSGHLELAAALLGIEPGRIVEVRDGLVRAGAANDAKIVAVIDALRDARGKPLLTEAQLRMQSTRDILRLISLGSVPEGRGRGRLFKPEATLEAIDGWWKAEGRASTIAQYKNSGAPEETVHATVDADWADYRANVAAKLKTHGEGVQVKDMFTALAGRVANALGVGGHNVKLETEVPSMGGRTVREVTQRLVDAVSGKQLVETKPAEAPAAPVDPVSEIAAAARGEPAVELKPEELTTAVVAAKYSIAQGASREVRGHLNNLGIYGPNLLEGSRAETVLLNRIANGDPEIRQVLLDRIGTNLVGSGAITPEHTTEAVEAMLGERYDALRVAVDKLQAYAQSYLESAITLGQPERAAQVRTTLSLVHDGLEAEARGEPLPQRVIDGLKAIDADGLIDESGPQTRIRQGFEFNLAKTVHRLFAEHAKSEGRIVDPSEQVLFHAGPSSEHAATAVRVATALMNFSLGFREQLLGRPDPYRNIDAEIYDPSKLSPKRLLQKMASEDGFWSTPQGKGIAALAAPVLEAYQRHWIGYRNKRGLHTGDVREFNVGLSRIVADAQAEMQELLHSTQVVLHQMRDMNLTSEGAAIIGKALESRGAARIRSRREWQALFGGDPRMFDTMVDIHGQLVAQGEKMVELGLIDRDAFVQLRDTYLPKAFLEWGFGPDGPTAYVKRNLEPHGYAVASSEHERASAEPRLDAVRTYDVRYILPILTGKNVKRIQLFRVLHRMASELHVASKAEWEAMGPLQRAQYRKATSAGLEIDREGNAIPVIKPSEAATLGPQERLHALKERSEATIESTMLHQFIADERAMRTGEDGPAMTPQLEQLFSKLEGGYITHYAARELSHLLEASDLSPSPARNKLSDWVQQMTLEWRQMRTVQNPKHWVLQFLSNWVTNSATGKVPMSDMLSSILIGEGAYADAAHHLMQWDQAVKSGRPRAEWSPDAQQFAEFVKVLGGGTLHHMIAEPVRAEDMIWSMVDPRADAGGEFAAVPENASESTKMLGAAMRAVARTRRGWSSLSERVGELSGSPHPSLRAEAVRSLMGVYGLHEMFWKYAATLHGMKSGMSLRAAAEWGAEGTGDYSDVNPLMRRLTTNFSVGDGRLRDLAQKRMGYGPGRRVAAQLVRMGVASPFWMYRASMLPTMARKQFTWKGISATAAMSFLIRAIGQAFGGDDQDLAEALADGHGFAGLSQDSPALEIVRRRHGDVRLPGFGGGGYPQSLTSTVDETLQLWKAYGENLANLASLGLIGEHRPEAQLLTKARGPTAGGQSTYFDMADFMPIVSLTNNVGDTLLGGERDDTTRLNAGFIPHAAAASAVDMARLLRVAMGSGERGKSGSVVVGEVLSDISAELSSPMGGGMFGVLASREGQSALRTVIWDGASVGEIIDGIPSSSKPSDFGEMLSTLAARTVLPARRVSNRPVTSPKSDWSFSETLGVRDYEAQQSDPERAAFDRRSTQIRATAMNLLSQAYKQSLDERTRPYAALVANALDMRGDIVRNDDGTLDVVAEPRSEFGRWLRSRGSSAEERRPWVQETVDALKERRQRIGQLLGNEYGSDLGLAYRKDVDPALHDRLVRAAWDDAEGRNHLMRYLWSQMQDGNNDPGVLARIWVTTGMDRMGPRMQRDEREVWLKASAFVKDQLRGASVDLSPLSPAEFRKALGGAVYDVSPVRAVQNLPVKGIGELRSEYPALFGDQ